MKKFQLLIVAFGVLAFTACNQAQQSNEMESEEPAVEETVTDEATEQSDTLVLEEEVADTTENVE